MTPPAIITLGVMTLASLMKTSPPDVSVTVTLVPRRVARVEPFLSDVLYNGSSETITWYSRIEMRSGVERLVRAEPIAWNALRYVRICQRDGVWTYLLFGAKMVTLPRLLAASSMLVAFRAPKAEVRPAETRVEETFCGSVRTPSMTWIMPPV